MLKLPTQTERNEQHKSIIASGIRKEFRLSAPKKGQRCFAYVSFHHNGQVVTNKIEMVCISSNLGKGNVWLFICPTTGKRCRKLHLINGRYQHRSSIKSYYCKINPLAYKDRQFHKICLLVQGKIDAEQIMSQKTFRRYYRGRPTKRYLKCLQQIHECGPLTMGGLINGDYGGMRT